jgi:Family of unknown function (DUF6390)
MEIATLSLSGGPETFCRYAQPPNLLGYCGPDDSGGFTSIAGGLAVPVEEVERVARAFHGAWPYLELIGGLTGFSPLSKEVVEAYWIGNRLLGRIPLHNWGYSVSDRFRMQAEGRWGAVENALNGGGLPNHAFHVFCVYPWVGLLREGFVGPSLRVLDRCRISWGTVVSVEGGLAVVGRRPLVWEDDSLSQGGPVEEPYRIPPELVIWPGNIVSLHWDFVCDRLGRDGLAHLRSVHDKHLAIANTELTAARSEPAR